MLNGLALDVIETISSWHTLHCVPAHCVLCFCVLIYCIGLNVKKRTLNLKLKKTLKT